MDRTKLDLTPYIEDASMQTVAQMAESIKNAWVQEAKDKLRTTANSYVNSIRSRMRFNGGEGTAEVYLEGAWANKLEAGFAPYDMKPIFARSKKRLTSQSGQWYLHVPFRHTAPTSTGRLGASMPNSVYYQARKLPQWGKLTSDTGKASWGRYEGMQKIPESKTSNRSAYMTWRTVSENSPSIAFTHPGFKGVHIADNLAPQIEDTFSKLFASNMEHKLGDNTR